MARRKAGRPSIPDRRKTMLSLDRGVLGLADREAKRYGLTRSAYISILILNAPELKAIEDDSDDG